MYLLLLLLLRVLLFYYFSIFFPIRKHFTVSPHLLVTKHEKIQQDLNQSISCISRIDNNSCHKVQHFTVQSQCQSYQEIVHYMFFIQDKVLDKMDDILVLCVW